MFAAPTDIFLLLRALPCFFLYMKGRSKSETAAESSDSKSPKGKKLRHKFFNKKYFMAFYNFVFYDSPPPRIGGMKY